MGKLQAARMRGEIRLCRAVLHQVDADLKHAFARRDRYAVRQLECEAGLLRAKYAELRQEARANRAVG
jgi:hypothetical protein